MASYKLLFPHLACLVTGKRSKALKLSLAPHTELWMVEGSVTGTSHRYGSAFTNKFPEKTMSPHGEPATRLTNI